MRSLIIFLVVLLPLLALASSVNPVSTLPPNPLPGIVIPAKRPPPMKRKFNSTLIDSFISGFVANISDPKLATLFTNCFPNTLDTTVEFASFNDTFVITGDIPAMWLRDSTNQVMPYIPFAEKEAEMSSGGEPPQLLKLFTGLVRRQSRSLLISTYADAFNFNASGFGPWQHDHRYPPMVPALFEGKYELDGMCAVIKLSYNVWKALQKSNSGYKLFEPSSDIAKKYFGDESTVDLWIGAMEQVLVTMTNQSMSTAEQQGNYPYRFERAPRDLWPHIWPMAWTGMVRSAFRPSDDETTYDFLVPSNAMAHVELGHMEEMFRYILDSPEIPQSSKAKITPLMMTAVHDLRAGIHLGLNESAPRIIRSDPDKYEKVFSYEVDGNGNRNNMDDANVPSLLSLPFLHYINEDSSAEQWALYNSTRKWVLSSANPWYFEGTMGSGIGSPHTGPNRIWPMSIIMRALTSEDESEISEQITTLIRSANTTGFMHESFDKDDVLNFTRSWFAWANTLFGEMIVHVAEKFPRLIN